MSGILKSLGKIAAVVLGVAAIVFTAGAAIPAIGAIVGTGGFGAAIGGVTASLGLTGTLGAVVTGAVTAAGFGAAGGALLAGISGKDPLDGAVTGMIGGAVTGGLMGGLMFDPLAAVSSTPMNSAFAGMPAASEAAAPSIASSGVAGSVGEQAGLTGATAPVTPVASAALPDIGATGTASNGAGGLLSQAPVASPYVPTAAPTPAAVAPSAASVGAAGTAAPAAAAPAANNGIISTIFGNNTDLAGKVISGAAQGLMSGQDATDAAKVGLNRDQAARDATSANYGGAVSTAPGGGYNNGTGGLLRPVASPSGLPAPKQAFNPTARWVFDPASKKLVLVPASSTPTA